MRIDLLCLGCLYIVANVISSSLLVDEISQNCMFSKGMTRYNLYFTARRRKECVRNV